MRDPDLLSYAAQARRVAALDFGVPPDDALPFLLLWGTRPECVRETADRRYDVYLASGSDPWQARLQIGHELFHRVAGAGNVFHWTHEMLACVFSMRLLKRHGLADYAAQSEAQYECDAAACPVSVLMSADPWQGATYPVGYYGRAFVTGAKLAAAVGYPALCRLARTVDDTGTPDFAAWLESLPGNAERFAASAVLKETL